MKRIQVFIDHVLTAFFPNCCHLCDEVVSPGVYVCRRCRNKAPYIFPPICLQCGRGEDMCICAGHKRAFARCVSPYYHTGTARDGVLRLKDTGCIPYVRGFVREMAEVVRREYGGIGFHWVTSVPLHHSDIRRRGFNQAALLAKELAVALGVPYRPLLKKLYRTAPQKELTARQRSGNLLGAFDVVQPTALLGRTVLLVDDVITTGATLEECAKMLKIFGADEVYAVTAAAATLKNEDHDKEQGEEKQ